MLSETKIRSIPFALLLLTSLLRAQEAKIEATLVPSRVIIAPDGILECRLTVLVKEDTELDLSVLSGADLQIFFGEKRLPGIEEKRSGTVQVKAGTRVERVLTVSMEKVMAGIAGDDLVTLNLRWPGLPGASTEVRVIPNQRAIDLETLDLAKTKVRLVTNYGDLVLQFRPDKAPGHVRNFIKLAKDGFYNGTRFHRVISGFMVQGGCPNTKEGAEGIPGSGDPGYKIDAEFNDIAHVRGVLSMARSTDPDSAGCQFFVCHGTVPHLDNKYSAFGSLDTGFDVLDEIAGVRVGGKAGSTPVEPVHLYAAIVIPVLQK